MEVIWYIVATFAAFYIKGLCGFANTLVFDAILGFTTANINISPLELVLGYPSNMILAYKERKLLNRKIWLPMVLIVIAGNIPGVLILKNADASTVKVFFGIAVILIGIQMLGKEYGYFNKPLPKPVSMLLGICSGILCGIYGVGVLVAAFLNSQIEDHNTFKGNMAMVFVFENTFRIIMYSITGIITLDILKRAVCLLPFMIAAVFLGIKSADVLDAKKAKKIVIVLLILSGISLIAKNLVG